MQGDLRYGFPFSGRSREALEDFLRKNGLSYDHRITFSVNLMEEGEIAASGSLDGSILKCIAVSPHHQSEGLAAVIVTELIKEAARNGVSHLFIYTKPEYAELFSNLGFYPIAQTADVLLLENKKEGIRSFITGLQRPVITGPQKNYAVGAAVVNCNPFTNGHRYLIEEAAKQCGVLHLFVVSEDRSDFPAEVRYRLVVEGTAHLPQVLVHPTGPYLISAATFPDYFLKDAVSPQEVNTELDLTIFAEQYAPPLGIQCRFVGTEPTDPVTAAYNSRMKEILPRYGIEVCEIPRLEQGNGAVSAGRVRLLLAQGNFAAIADLVPPSTLNHLKKHYENHE